LTTWSRKACGDGHHFGSRLIEHGIRDLLSPQEAGVFLEAMQLLYPQHYAMTYVAVATGLRPSSLRPLRRKGAETDVLWETNEILIRRSQTVGAEVMTKTKTGLKQRIALPEEVMAVLKWHVDTQVTTPEMQASDLLFPSVLGGFRSPTVLNKPFADVAERIGLGKKFTQRGLRRTFNDLARAAEIESIVTKKISGHQTDAMVERYSTVRAEEQQGAIRRIMATMAEQPEETTTKAVQTEQEAARPTAKAMPDEPSDCGTNSVGGVPAPPVKQTETEQPSTEGARLPS
jgi:integrase